MFPNLRSCVLAFHEKYGIPIGAAPKVPDSARVLLRMQLITEEYIEVIQKLGFKVNVSWVQMASPDIVGLAKELEDLKYVIEGTHIEFGIDSAPILVTVHASNLSKLGDDGRPVYREDGKVMKGPNYREPDIAGELREQGWEPPKMPEYQGPCECSRCEDGGCCGGFGG